MQSELLEPEVKQNDRFDLGQGYCLHLPRGPRRPGDLYHQGTLSKRVNLADKAERRLLVVELLQKAISQTRLAEVLNLSRQTLHNYRESYRLFGVTGLLHGYSPSDSQSEELQRRLHVTQRRPGSKARELEALRRAQKAQTPATGQDELAWDGEAAATYVLEETPLEAVGRSEQPAAEARPEENPPPTQSLAGPTSTDAAPAQEIELPYAANHGWEACRYAGIFPVLAVLVSQAPWLQRLFRLFGNGWRLFMVFVLMAVRNIRSIEQLKHERHQEAGRILGVGRLPALDTLWCWFHDVADLQRSGELLKAFFADQLRCGLVGARLWFTDGHLLPYTGQDKVHAAWSTQRSMPMPGQTNLVTCDEQGRVVYFDIQEGRGDLRARILALGDWAREQLPGTPPVHVFDREGDGLGFFSALVRRRTPFITWEKNADQERLMALPAADFVPLIPGRTVRIVVYRSCRAWGRSGAGRCCVRRVETVLRPPWTVTRARWSPSISSICAGWWCGICARTTVPVCCAGTANSPGLRKRWRPGCSVAGGRRRTPSSTSRRVIPIITARVSRSARATNRTSPILGSRRWRSRSHRPRNCCPSSTRNSPRPNPTSIGTGVNDPTAHIGG